MIKTCPPGKELNLKTNRCRTKCSNKKHRNKNGNCVSTKLRPSIKLCPDNKELNPKTNRCRTKCAERKHRNEKGNCVF